MKWETRRPEPTPTDLVLERGPVRVVVGPSHNDPSLRWQYFTVTLGQHSPASQESCMQTWPREGIGLARAALDEFEAQLTELKE